MQVEVIPMLINSDFMNVPLDKLLHLTDYKMYGEDSYVFQQKELLYELYECTYLSMNDKELSAEALDYLLKNNKNIGEALSNVYGIERKDILSTLSTMSAVINSSTAMSVVINSSTAMSAVANSSTAMARLSTSSLRKRVNNGQKATGLMLPMSLGGNTYFYRQDIGNYGRIEYVDGSLQTFADGWTKGYTNWGDVLRQKPLEAKLVRVFSGGGSDNWVDIILISGTITNI